MLKENLPKNSILHRNRCDPFLFSVILSFRTKFIEPYCPVGSARSARPARVQPVHHVSSPCPARPARPAQLLSLALSAAVNVCSTSASSSFWSLLLFYFKHFPKGFQKCKKRHSLRSYLQTLSNVVKNNVKSADGQALVQ